MRMVAQLVRLCPDHIELANVAFPLIKLVLEQPEHEQLHEVSSSPI